MGERRTRYGRLRFPASDSGHVEGERIQRSFHRLPASTRCRRRGLRGCARFVDHLRASADSRRS